MKNILEKPSLSERNAKATLIKVAAADYIGRELAKDASFKSLYEAAKAGVKVTSKAVKGGAGTASRAVKGGAEAAGRAVKGGAEAAGRAVKGGAEATGRAVKGGAEAVKGKGQELYKKVLENPKLRENITIPMAGLGGGVVGGTIGASIITRKRKEKRRT